MSTEMPTTNVVDMPVEQVTQAIVAAAKRVRKPKAEITIIEQIITDILAGKFAEEAATHLKQIFGDEFCIKRGLMEKPKKTRKPKAPKEPVVSEATVVSEAPAVTEEKPTKEKKARKPKAPKEPVVSEAVVSVSEKAVTPVLETDEFSSNWRKPIEELVEEELSDIEEEE